MQVLRIYVFWVIHISWYNPPPLLNLIFLDSNAVEEIEPNAF